MLKNTLTIAFKQLFASRYLTILSVVMVVIAILFIGYIALTVRPSELQLVTHYTAYGVTKLYRSPWFYLLTFGAFGLLIAALHLGLALKVLLVKGPSLAIMFIWLGIGTLLFAWVTSYAIINIWSPI